jgi:hypothetical protein
MMAATHLYMEAIKTADMLPRDLDRRNYAMPEGMTYRRSMMQEAARNAWSLAAFVVSEEPEDRTQ